MDLTLDPVEDLDFDNQSGGPTAVGVRSAARAIILNGGDVQRAIRLAGTSWATQLGAIYLTHADDIDTLRRNESVLGYEPELWLLRVCQLRYSRSPARISLLESAIQLYT